MKFTGPLVPATLVQRYKRFLFDAILTDGTAITGSCPNTGSMRGLTTPGSRIWLSEHDSTTRKYRHMLEIVEADGTLVGINTGLPNRIAEEAISAGQVSNLDSYDTLRREQRYGRNSRIDILLSDAEKGLAYVEVKNVHFSRLSGLAEFPDSPTERGAKHLEELGDMVAAGHRAIMLYLVQRDDCSRFRICRELDPVYARAFERASTRGVEAYAVKCQVSPLQIVATGPMMVDEAVPAVL
ncbi:DNA/RNA nuclease SfsA [Sinorhizobium medicae]|uniref:Sugar fermentation stimulation protein homolog n=2 Tax=Sinorhizobium medicae TaxID=110321 RepID=SFSA_SINMW|nr:DNA/RNA nuclease SfsA [Sinorhizobium medicae]A6U9H2.1 RecName: Full=Sugar fermentation stimulation protein homolog [Sinorhizobium medicae WSM419]ABR60302.1 sugar fermentation stimulation protein [Sinorhizobium medicae WSM419]MBO1940315.1 DNA/RNA nuclease SfsA [Sinorhizobium medicae]MBO1962468.1 DNA/RNA nuclease SfsA [Sinorhizobium medicae]MDX0407617.1 DNA/RNA nuclease SfsA [Sinorhizobium medicae]MDX0414192.1 DNA/RNA nuclease SfsA [Sinorhizobium medicae]